MATLKNNYYVKNSYNDIKIFYKEVDAEGSAPSRPTDFTPSEWVTECPDYAKNKTIYQTTRSSSDEEKYHFTEPIKLEEAPNLQHMLYTPKDGLIISMNSNYSNSGRNVQITSNGINIRQNTDVLASFGDNIRLGKSDQDNLLITSGGINLYNKDVKMASFESDGMTLYKDNSTTIAGFKTNEITLGQTGTSNINIKSDKISFNYNNAGTPPLSFELKNQIDTKTDYKYETVFTSDTKSGNTYSLFIYEIVKLKDNSITIKVERNIEGQADPVTIIDTTTITGTFNSDTNELSFTIPKVKEGTAEKSVNIFEGDSLELTLNCEYISSKSGQITINGETMEDYVVEYNPCDAKGWTWKKWASGTIEAWRKIKREVKMSSKLGSYLWYNKSNTAWALPREKNGNEIFKSSDLLPNIQLTTQIDSGATYNFIFLTVERKLYANNSKLGMAFNTMCMSDSDKNSITPSMYVHVYLNGKYK